MREKERQAWNSGELWGAGKGKGRDDDEEIIGDRRLSLLSLIALVLLTMSCAFHSSSPFQLPNRQFFFFPSSSILLYTSIPFARFSLKFSCRVHA